VGKDTHQPTIELNGQRFNASTGKLIDGFSRVNQLVKPDVTPASSHSINRQPANSSKQMHKTAQHSRTLMRYAVKKPSTITTRVTVAMDVVPHKSGLATTEVFHKADSIRMHRAATTAQNSLVSRFGDMKSDFKSRNSAQHTDIMRQQPQPSTPRVEAVTTPITQRSTVTSMLLDKGLRAADSHSEVSVKKAKLHHRVGKIFGLSARGATISVSCLVVLVIGGLYMYQNIPDLSVRYASAKSGVRATLPNYQPSGFAVNSHIQYSPGELTIAYKANTGSRTYTVTQRNTSWNSDALKDHLTTIGGITPQTYPDNGRTIYLHDDNSADWVNSGVWYHITGNANLNTDQLIKIASSL
jgi:hypothetical protein